MNQTSIHIAKAVAPIWSPPDQVASFLNGESVCRHELRQIAKSYADRASFHNDWAKVHAAWAFVWALHDDELIATAGHAAEALAWTMEPCAGNAGYRGECEDAAKEVISEVYCI